MGQRYNTWADSALLLWRGKLRHSYRRTRGQALGQPYAQRSTRACLQPGACSASPKIRPALCTHGYPKLQALIRFLSDMNAKETAWHGIVVVKERQSVHTLTHMLQQVPDFANEVSFHPCTGHGHQKQQQVTVGSFSRGMKITAQKDALKRFRCGEGRQVLIDTAAAEEGLDIVDCHFVVCFMVVESGHELIQRAGRARMRGSQVVHIVNRGSGDEASLLKAEQEKLNAGNAQLHFSHVVP